MKRVVSVILCLVIAILPLASCDNKRDADPVIDTEGYKDDMSEYISVPELSEIVVPDSEVGQEWQKTALAIRLQNTVYSPVEEKDATVAVYDKVSIDYSPSDGRQTEGLSMSGYEVIVGSGTLVGEYKDGDGNILTASFESQLVGAAAGGSVTVTVTFPDDYTYTDAGGSLSDELAGAKVSLDVKINSISRGEVPELSAPMISNYTAGEYTTVEAYRDYIYAYYRSAIAYNTIVERAEIRKYPEDELYSARLNYISSVIEDKYSGVKLDDEDVKTLYDSLYSEADAYARAAVFERMVLEYLFAKCGITLTESGYQSMLERDYGGSYYYYYMYYGVTTAEEYESYFGKENLVLQYKYQKLLDVLPSFVTIEQGE